MSGNLNSPAVLRQRQARTLSSFAQAAFPRRPSRICRPSPSPTRKTSCIVREAIEREFPDDGILGEEGSSRSGSSRRRWIVDPIDGTRDFVRGNRFWCVLIALEEQGEPVVGVAHFPLLDETYWAVRGGGAYLNRERLRVSSIGSISDCVFSPNGLHLVEARSLPAARHGTHAAFVGRSILWRPTGRLHACRRYGGDLVRAQGRGLGSCATQADHRRGGRGVLRARWFTAHRQGHGACVRPRGLTSCARSLRHRAGAEAASMLGWNGSFSTSEGSMCSILKPVNPHNSDMSGEAILKIQNGR